MNSINLRSRQLTVVKIVKKTKARLFSEFREGTTFRISMELRPTTGASNGLYALCVKVNNITTDESATFSQNEVLKYLSCFEYGRRGNQ